jgi:hypothetical protein
VPPIPDFDAGITVIPTGIGTQCGAGCTCAAGLHCDNPLGEVCPTAYAFCLP